MMSEPTCSFGSKSFSTILFFRIAPQTAGTAALTCRVLWWVLSPPDEDPTGRVVGCSCSRVQWTADLHGFEIF